MRIRASLGDKSRRRTVAFRRCALLAFAFSCVAGAPIAAAEEAQEGEGKEDRKPAIWIAPEQLLSSKTRASWRDERPVAAAFSDSSRVVATGANHAIIEAMGAYWLADSSFRTLTPIDYPGEMRWTTVDGTGRVLALVGDKLYTQSGSGDFVAVLDMPDVRAIDGVDSVVVYADAQKLSIADLAQGTVRTIALGDFFDDEKVAQMTPEAVAEADAAAKKKKKSKAKEAKADAGSSVVQIAEMTGIWWRHDGVGVVRVRSILNVRTFATADNGRSWRLMEDSPESIVHEFGWIWDGKSRVLSADASQWIEVSGKAYSPAERFLSTQTVEIAGGLPDRWTRLESPGAVERAEKDGEEANKDGEEANKDGEKANVESSSDETCQNPDGTPCEKLALISESPGLKREYPIMQARSEGKARGENDEGLYAPRSEAQGLRLWLTRDARCLLPENCTSEAIQEPRAWMQRPDDAAPVPIELPKDCLPRYIGAQKGLGIVFCEKSDETVGVYTRSSSVDWAFETELPASSVDGMNTRLYSADDGTLIVVGRCVDEVVEQAASSEGAEPETAAVPQARRVCDVAIRRPNEVGILATPIYRASEAESLSSSQESKDEAEDKSDGASSGTGSEDKTATAPTWRIERPENVVGFVPLHSGAFLTVESTGKTPAHLLRLWAPEKGNRPAPTGAYSELLSESFDPSPFDGLVMTEEGCLSLYDASSSESKLLAVDGGFANMTCADSRAVALEERAKREAQAQEGQAIGDDHYGVRLGAGGFFTVDDVQTWFMRIEALIPLYGGQYEVGLMYRMAGGNKPTAMGHLGIASVRWRYDGLESFDFAVGAGIGFGSMCGYEKPKETSSEIVEDEEEEETSGTRSGYEKCSTYSLRYLISGIATYKFNDQWKLFISAELLGGSNWGFDVSGGIEIRF